MERAFGWRSLAVVAASVGAIGALSGCGASSDPDLIAGKRLFVERCGSCHVLERAGTRGTAGPDLDEAFHQSKSEGFGESAIRGVVAKQIEYPSRGARPCEPDCTRMPADLVKGRRVQDVAAYVAKVAAAGGRDTGLLASAVPAAGSGRPVRAVDGILRIPADPTGQLAYATTQASAPAGELDVESPNRSGTPHDIVIDGKGRGRVVSNGGVSEFRANFTSGRYTFYCSVPGHRQAGMQGTLTVR